MLRVANMLNAHFGARTVVHGLMCLAGQPWDDGYYSWLDHSVVKLILLSENYFENSACKMEFKMACNKVPDPRSMGKVVIPVVLTTLPWRYPGSDPREHCTPGFSIALC